ncbi:hypothetical protein [Legionella micdadei]|uniref:Dot/Icm T4SS effector n=1 Tax=Legionella micdadei TaxID=451 RepID=A0A098GEI9_LEGMI|nr:hypothetical protein [Legionella micdadei]ARG98421.1 hypothetical protein B6N58_12555 [Legionella micdadei]ARH01168.1 hypothetical protein B6V88_12565 [Legionella micdadei]KTD30372.1 hypothetical protein Lmic_0123 [Legionella micdadei]NSL18353.1 hypothetical protein [Legionella micdadei]CEG59896.1 conserved protein of unknown function [Legionella micdadei]
MPINLTKHSKIWIHPDGLLPDKIVNRLVFQREVRPKDELTFFVNQACAERTADKIALLKEHGIKIKIIEECLEEKFDDEFLIGFAKKVIHRLTETKKVRDTVYATDVLRLMKVVQREGLYSDNDVLFLNFNDTREIMKKYLFGCHTHGMPDIHIFGIDLNYCEDFYKELIAKIKEMCGDPPYPDEEVCAIPGLAFIPDSINLIAYGHLAFQATSDNIISGKDNSHDGGEEILHAVGNDPLLEEAKLALKEGHVRKKPLSNFIEDSDNDTSPGLGRR